MSRAALFCLLLFACATVGERPETAEPLTYRIVHDVPGRALQVELVLPADHPRQFSFTAPWGEVALEVTSARGATRTLHTEASGAISLPEDVRRVRYTYPLTRKADLVSGVITEDGAVVAGRAYLIRPRSADRSREVRLFADGQLPWPRSGGEPFYRLREPDLVDSGFHTFGGRSCPDGSTVRVRLLGPAPAIGDAGLCAWMAQALREVLTVRRPFPWPGAAITVVVVPSERASPFGMMLWSHPPSLALYAGANATAEAFAGDWVAVHELLHLTHPSFLQRAKWLSEGLATYLTEVARMRSGRRTPEEGWREVWEGIRRGEDDARGRSLGALAEGGGGYVGYYWGGALVALELDVAIRKATSGERRLDDVLELLGTRGSSASPEAFGAAVDEVAGAPLWDTLVPARLSAPATQGAAELLERLGIRMEGEVLLLDDAAPDAAHRRAITHGRR